MTGAVTDEEFAGAMAVLGPFEPAPRIAAGVSGGADSTALALLADRWARLRGGSLLALIVDHGLRVEAAAEAATTAARLGERGIAARVLRIAGLSRGPALAQRARDARFRLLSDTCAAEGILHLLLGHHAGDQAETVLIRALGGSGPAGMAGMLPLVEQTSVRIVRPLLPMAPVRLRAMLTAAGVGWVEDPSNVDCSALRPRLRALRRDRDGTGAATRALVASATASARQRALDEAQVAAELAECVALRPEGFAVLPGGAPSSQALAALIQAIAGATFPPPTEAVAALAAAPRAATLAGARLIPVGRPRPGWLLVREAVAMAPPIAAVVGAVWDRRFRLVVGRALPNGATLGALGDDASRLRRFSPLPSAALRTLPAIRLGDTLLAVPHLRYPDCRVCEGIRLLFSPPRPATAASCRFGDA